MNSRDPSLSFRITEPIRKALERAAQAEDRSVSALVRRIIMDWMRRQPPMALGKKRPNQ